MKEKVCQLVHTLSYGDAISGEVIAMHRLLEENGFESNIYSINTHPKYKGLTKNYKELPLDTTAKVILHYSLGSDLNRVYENLNSAKRALVYHNITPYHFFEGVNPRIVNDIKSGILEFPKLCKITDLIIADSSFNALDIEKLGLEAKVLPLLFDNKKWNIEANVGIESILQKDNTINILHTGRLAPNKCIEDIIKSFYFLHHKIEKNSKLYLIGIDVDTEIYSFMLKELVAALNLKDAVRFCGSVADSELKAFYKNSSVYLSMSEHEGFCVPILEAMNFSLPVVSYKSTALEDTVGNGGILVSEKKHEYIGEILYKVATDNKIRQEMIKAGKERISEFSEKNFSKKFLNLVKSF
ncbi:MAG: glycosyltransferase [Bdellovibrionota bacterium]